MRKIELVDFLGEHVATLNLPSTPDEVKFRQFVNFSATLMRITDWAEKQKDLDPITYLTRKVEILSEFFEVDIMTFYDVELGSLDAYQAVEMENSIVWLLNYLKNLCSHYETPMKRVAKNHRFKYRGETFHLPYYRASAYVKDLLNRPGLTVAEATEALEITRIKEKLLDDDPQGSEWYTKGLTMVAILCRKAGEEFPEDPAGVKKLIQERVEFFKDIDMCTVRDVSFFLNSIMRKLAKKRRLGISSSRRTRLPIAKKVAKR